MTRPPPSYTLFPYTTLFRSQVTRRPPGVVVGEGHELGARGDDAAGTARSAFVALQREHGDLRMSGADRKSTRLNSSHPSISYAVFCLKKKNNTNKRIISETS